MVKNIRIGGDSDPEEFFSVGDTLFFAADDGVHGRELWKSDGTWAGTVMVKDITEVGGSSLSGFTAFDSLLYFRVSDQLWKSDGTADGTEMVKAFTNLDEIEPTSNILFLKADDGIHGDELWKSDGTEAGTTLVKDIYGGAEDSDIYDITSVDGFVIFQADDGTHGRNCGSPMVIRRHESCQRHQPRRKQRWPLCDHRGKWYWVFHRCDEIRHGALYRRTSEGTVMISGTSSLTGQVTSTI